MCDLRKKLLKRCAVWGVIFTCLSTGILLGGQILDVARKAIAVLDTPELLKDLSIRVDKIGRKVDVLEARAPEDRPGADRQPDGRPYMATSRRDILNTPPPAD